jgi:hypothetical protein
MEHLSGDRSFEHSADGNSAGSIVPARGWWRSEGSAADIADEDGMICRCCRRLGCLSVLWCVISRATGSSLYELSLHMGGLSGDRSHRWRYA